MVIIDLIKKVFDWLSWVNFQPFPPAVKAFLHTILKGMLFTAGEKAFEQLVRNFFWVKEKLQTWWKGKKAEAEDEEE